jgi:hypothetical protein
MRMSRPGSPTRVLGGLLLGVAAATSGCSRDAPARELGSPVEIDGPATMRSGEPNLAVGADGRVLLTWIEPLEEGGHRLRFSTLRDGAWEEPRTVATGDDWFVNWADFPAMTELPDGRLAAHYLQRHPEALRGYHYDVRIVQSADGGSNWSEPITPHRAGVPAEYGFVSLFPEPNGELGVIWLDGRGFDEAYGATGEMTLRATTVGADGALGPEILLDDRICECCQTSVAFAGSGPVVVYRDRSGEEVRDISIARRLGGSWTAPQPVHRDGWVIPACPVNGPSVSAQGDALAVAWFTAASDTTRVLVAFSSDGGANFSVPVRVDEGDPLGRAAVAMLPDGSALVAWLERTGEAEAAVRYRRVGPSGEASTPGTVGVTTATRASGFPRLIASGATVVFAWTANEPERRVRTALLRLEESR